MNNIPDTDNRISLLNFGDKKITLKNTLQGVETTFEIEEEAGRGTSCICYKAWILNGEEKYLPVLLKEFYPNRLVNCLIRDEVTHGLILDSSSDMKEKFYEQRGRFIRTCEKQNEFYRANTDAVDDLVPVYAMYTLKDSFFALMSAAGGCTWNEIKNETIHEIFSTAIEILRQLEIFFRNGLLHLDLKGSNIYVYSPNRQIKILDMGSVQEMTGEHLTGKESFSYTDEYAAPEILELCNQENEEDRADYAYQITTKADLYSLAAVVYKKLTGKFVPRGSSEYEKFERAIELKKLWQTERNGRVKNIPEFVRSELENFFNLTLSKKTKDRSTLPEMKKQLQSILNHVSPPLFALSKEIRAVHPVENFFGRTQELLQLNEWLDKGKSVIFLYGLPGGGKSQLSLKLADERKNDYDCYRISFNESLENTIISLPTSPPFSAPPNTPINSKEIYKRNLEILNTHGDTTLLIIDNFASNIEELHSKAYQDLQRTRMKIIFTCRQRPPLEETSLEVGELSDVELLQLMKTYCNADNETLLKLIEIAGRNTLIVESMARIISGSLGEIQPQKLIEQMQTSENGTLYEKLKMLFEISKLGKRAKKIMAETALLPEQGVNSCTFLKCHLEEDKNQIKVLEMCGYIKYTDFLINVHPLIRKICREILPDYEKECDVFLQNYAEIFGNLPNEESLAQQNQQLEIFANAADFLEDIEGNYSLYGGQLFFVVNKYSDSLKYLEKHIKKFFALNPAPDPEEAVNWLNFLLYAALFSSNFSKALKYANEKLRYAEIAFEENSSAVLKCKIESANAKNVCGYTADALNDFLNIINSFEQYEFTDEREKLVLFMNCLQELAFISVWESGNVVAEEYFKALKNIFKRYTGISEAEDFLTNTLNNYTPALLDENFPLEFQLSVRFVEIQFLLHSEFYAKALPLIEDFMNNLENEHVSEIFPKKIYKLYACLMKSVSLAGLERYPEAVELLNKTLKVAEESFGENSMIAIQTYLIVAQHYLAEDNAKAKIYLQKIIENAELIGEDHPFIMKAKNYLEELNA